MGAEMPWFPDFASAVELVRRQTRAAGQADPVAQYFTVVEGRASGQDGPGPAEDRSKPPAAVR